MTTNTYIQEARKHSASTDMFITLNYFNTKSHVMQHHHRINEKSTKQILHTSGETQTRGKGQNEIKYIHTRSMTITPKNQLLRRFDQGCSKEAI